VDKARGAENMVIILVINLGRSWRAFWVCGEGRVDQAGHTMSLGTSLAGGCYLGIPHERYLWRVHVIGRGPGVECLRGTKPRDGRCYFSMGH
jgi:hypothetical protein